MPPIIESFTIDRYNKLTVKFPDKRTYNSFVKVFPKVTIETEYKYELLKNEFETLKNEYEKLQSDFYKMNKQIYDLSSENNELKSHISKNENDVNIITPDTFTSWKIIEKGGHIAIKPPKIGEREDIMINPTFSQEWAPILKGQYRNDGLYHFFPKSTKIHIKMTNDDIIDNLVMMGAEK